MSSFLEPASNPACAYLLTRLPTDSVDSFWSAAFTASTVPPVPAQSSAIILRLKTSVSPVAVVARHWLDLDGLEIGHIESSGKNRSHYPRARGVCGL